MSSQTTPEMRLRFHLLHEDGATYREIAQQYGLSVGCVRHWCRRQRDGGSVISLHPGRRPGLLQRFSPQVPLLLWQMRSQHPGWGTGMLRHKLAQQPALLGQRLPSRAQIGRYLHQYPQFRRPGRTTTAPTQRPDVATRVHQRWQLDFKQGLPLTDGCQVNLHTLRDPVGGVCLAARLSPAGPVGQAASKVRLAEVQASLRWAFAHWHTLPEEVQTDNETVLVGKLSEDFPSHFTLWLVGLGIRHVRSRPGRPTDNAEVERTHQTLLNAAIRGPDATSQSHLQAVLDQMVHELAYEVPSRASDCAHQPPVVAHPELLQPPRSFSPECEWLQFDLRRVDAYLAGHCWLRKVDRLGQINLGGYPERYSVGRSYAGQSVLVCFDPEPRHFTFFQSEMPYAQLGSRPARRLSVADLTGLADPDAGLVPQQLRLPLDIEPGVRC